MAARIVHGDAAKTLRSVRAGSVKLVITDPPYRGLTRGKMVYQDGIGYRQLGWPAIARHLAAARRRLARGGGAHARRQSG